MSPKIRRGLKFALPVSLALWGVILIAASACTRDTGRDLWRVAPVDAKP